MCVFSNSAIILEWTRKLRLYRFNGKFHALILMDSKDCSCLIFKYLSRMNYGTISTYLMSWKSPVAFLNMPLRALLKVISATFLCPIYFHFKHVPHRVFSVLLPCINTLCLWGKCKLVGHEKGSRIIPKRLTIASQKLRIHYPMQFWQNQQNDQTSKRTTCDKNSSIDFYPEIWFYLICSLHT